MLRLSHPAQPASELWSDVMNTAAPATRLLTATLFAAVALLALHSLAASTFQPPVAPPASERLVSVAGNQPSVSPEHVLVVMNAANEEGRAAAEYYLARRRIPEKNLLRLSCPDTVEWKREQYRDTLEYFVKDRARSNPKIEYVVLMKGIPYRFSDDGVEGGYSTDSVLATCLLPDFPSKKMRSPYYGRNVRFSRKETGILLVTRLDGATLPDIKALVDSSRNARPVAGPFYLRDSFCLSMKAANDRLTTRGFITEWMEGANQPGNPRYRGSTGGPYMAHYGAGPHDFRFTPEEYEAMRFLPGALGELTWSMSAADLRKPESLGNIAVMARNGAAGVQGFVSEPYADSLSRPEIVLDRYTRGYNLAESFAMGTPYLHWKQVILGDPLCAPYADPDSPQ